MGLTLEMTVFAYPAVSDGDPAKALGTSPPGPPICLALWCWLSILFPVLLLLSCLVFYFLTLVTFVVLVLSRRPKVLAMVFAKVIPVVIETIIRTLVSTLTAILVIAEKLVFLIFIGVNVPVVTF